LALSAEKKLATLPGHKAVETRLDWKTAAVADAR